MVITVTFMGRLIKIQAAVIIIYINTKTRVTESSLLPESKAKPATKSLSVHSQLQLWFFLTFLYFPKRYLFG